MGGAYERGVTTGGRRRPRVRNRVYWTGRRAEEESRGADPAPVPRRRPVHTAHVPGAAPVSSQSSGTAAGAPPHPRRTPQTAPGGARRWPLALRRTPVTLWNDDISDWAAALTYYAILALLPALLVTVSVIGLASPGATGALIADI